MIDPLIEAFSQFDRRIQPSEVQRCLAAKRADRLSHALNHTSSISECHVTGSLVRSTAIRKFSDVDILAIFDSRRDLPMADPGDLLELTYSISAVLARTITRNTNTITLNFSKWPNVDILPALIHGASDDMGALQIPAGSGIWGHYYPGADDLLIADGVRRHGPRFKAVVRTFKWWNKMNGEIMRSFEVERLARDTFAEGLPKSPQAVHMIFAAAIEACDHQRQRHALTETTIPTSSNYDVLKQAFILSTQAEEAAAVADFRGATLCWRRLLGEFFPVVAG
jgi:predicted nucleotidyltransferase